jgi:hypothetical protein
MISFKISISSISSYDWTYLKAIRKKARKQVKPEKKKKKKKKKREHGGDDFLFSRQNSKLPH